MCALQFSSDLLFWKMYAKRLHAEPYDLTGLNFDNLVYTFCI